MISCVKIGEFLTASALKVCVCSLAGKEALAAASVVKQSSCGFTSLCGWENLGRRHTIV